MEDTFSRLRETAVHVRPWLVPRPASGKLYLDILFLLLVGALHHTILPSLFGSFVLIDLMTPWLVTTFVAAPLPRAIVTLIVGALVLETHSAAPAGMYIAAYWVICVALRLTRSTLSWRHAFPWLVTFIVAEAWVILFETFVMSVSEGQLRLSFGYVVAQLVRLAVAAFFGMLLSHRLMTIGVGEDQS